MKRAIVCYLVWLIGAGALGAVLAFTVDNKGWQFWAILGLYILAFYMGRAS